MDLTSTQHHMTDRHQQRPQHHRHAIAENFIRQKATEDWRDIHQRTVGAK